VDFSHYSDDPVHLAVDLVNTYEIYSRVEHLEDVADLEAFLDEHTEGWARPDWRLTESDVQEVRALRSRLRDVFLAADDHEAAARLNGILADASATPRISIHDHADPHLHFESPGAKPSRWLGAITAMGLSVALIDGGFERFGRCSASACDDVFIDASRNRSRRHCSASCTTRENVAAYRRRKRAEDGTGA
jgi:predicted RNA-binding Zn ribbon-like protein